MPILRRPSRSDISVDDADRHPDDPPAPEESGAFVVAPRRQTLKMSAVAAPQSSARPASSAPPPMVLPSLVVPPPPPPPSSPMGARPPARQETVRMKAVKVPSDDGPPSGRMLDAVDFSGGGRQALELGAVPAGRAQLLGRPPTPLSTPKTPVTPISPVGSTEVLRRSEGLDPRRPGIFAFAGFGLPPETIVGAPAYALRVLLRKRILRAGLAIARRQRSPDVELYEAALRTGDQDAYAKGLLLLLVLVIFFLALVCIAVEIVS